MKCEGAVSYPLRILSHPVRGAWIEMLAEKVAYIDRMIVAPRQGCVD